MLEEGREYAVAWDSGEVEVTREAYDGTIIGIITEVHSK